MTTVSQKKPEPEFVNKPSQPGQRPVSGGISSRKMPAGERPQSHHGVPKNESPLKEKEMEQEKEKDVTPGGKKGSYKRPPSEEKRLDTQTSHGTEKAAAHEYVSSLINKSLRVRLKFGWLG